MSQNTGQFRKKPVIIEAMPFDGTEESATEIQSWMRDYGVKAVLGYPGSEFYIPTKEGVMNASAGDWIIKGVSNEFYPCKPDIFDLTYDPVEDTE